MLLYTGDDLYTGNDQVLAQCKEWAPYGKTVNGCTAFHQGWPAGSNSCNHCTKTDRAYTACDITECIALCQDLYGASASQKCKDGCNKYEELGGCSGNEIRLRKHFFIPPMSCCFACFLTTQSACFRELKKTCRFYRHLHFESRDFLCR